MNWRQKSKSYKRDFHPIKKPSLKNLKHELTKKVSMLDYKLNYNNGVRPLQSVIPI